MSEFGSLNRERLPPNHNVSLSVCKKSTSVAKTIKGQERLSVQDCHLKLHPGVKVLKCRQVFSFQQADCWVSLPSVS